jgi:hypothetical protein
MSVVRRNAHALVGILDSCKIANALTDAGLVPICRVFGKLAGEGDLQALRECLFFSPETGCAQTQWRARESSELPYQRPKSQLRRGDLLEPER